MAAYMKESLRGSFFTSKGGKTVFIMINHKTWGLVVVVDNHLSFIKIKSSIKDLLRLRFYEGFVKTDLKKLSSASKIKHI